MIEGIVKAGKGYSHIHMEWMKSPRNREFAIRAFEVAFTPNLGSLAPGTASGVPR